MLSELEPQFLKRVDSHHFNFVDSIAEADGIRFQCPKCTIENKGSIGTHGIICWKPTVPQDTSPTPGRWSLEGSGYSDLTLVAGSSSVLLLSGCKAHFFIRNGQIEGLT